MAEEVLIKIEVEKGTGEQQVDNMTRKILDLTNANKDLIKQNKELEKSGQQNSQQYIENTRQIEINKQKITEATASRKGLVQSLIAEDDSIKGLKIRNAELIKQRDQLSTSTAAGRAAIAAINAELDKNNETINANSSALEKQKFNIGNYKSALDGIVPGLGGFIDGIQGATKAGLAFIATPIGLVLAAIGAALFALTSYFKGSEEGQNRLNKVLAVGSAIMEQFMNVVEDAGEAIFNAINNPQQAIKDFGNLIKENIINRFEGILEFIPEISKSIDLLFKGKFTEAGIVAFDAVVKVTGGIENASAKIAGFVEETGRLVDEGIKNGERLAELQAKIDRDERALIVERAKSTLEVSKLREDAITQEGELKKKTIQEAIALEEELTKKEVEFAKTKLAQAQLLRDANGDDKEALKAVAQARADVFTAEATAFANTLKFRKQLQALDEETAKEKQKEVDEVKRINKEIEDAEKEQFENNLKLLEIQNEQESNRLKEKYLNGLIQKEQFEAQFTTLELTALEQRRAFLVANGEEVVAIDAAIIDKKIKNKEREAAAEKKILTEKEKGRQAEVRGIQTSLDLGVDLAKEAFGENKAIAVAETVINTIRGIVRAIAEFPFPYSVIVSGLVGALGTLQTQKILGITFARGGVLNGPSHARGGIPFTVGGVPGFEAEGGEAIINKKSTRMYRPLLSAINEAGGGTKFQKGGLTFATGGISGGTATRQAAQSAQNQSFVQDTIRNVMASMPPIVVTVEDINARTEEVSNATQKAQVI